MNKVFDYLKKIIIIIIIIIIIYFIFHKNYFNFFMFRDVPESSVFSVPGFIDGPKCQQY